MCFAVGSYVEHPTIPALSELEINHAPNPAIQESQAELAASVGFRVEARMESTSIEFVRVVSSIG